MNLHQRLIHNALSGQERSTVLALIPLQLNYFPEGLVLNNGSVATELLFIVINMGYWEDLLFL